MVPGIAKEFNQSRPANLTQAQLVVQFD